MANHATHPESTLAETPLPGTRSGSYTDIGEGRTVKSVETRSESPGLMARHRDALLVALVTALVTIFTATLGTVAYNFNSVNQSLLAMKDQIGDLEAGMLRTVNSEVGKLRAEMREEVGQLSERVNRIEERVTRVEERLARIEAILLDRLPPRDETAAPASS